MRWGNSGSATPSYVTDGSAWSNYAGIYHLDQAVGAAATDSSPHGNHAQMNDSANPPQKASVAIAGGAYNFTKNQNRWFSASSISGTVKLDDFTLSGWVRATTNDAQDWHDYYGINTTNGGQLRVEANNNNPPRIHVPASGIVHPNLYSSNNPAGKLDSDEWNHLVFTGTGGKLNLYMNESSTPPRISEAQIGGFVIAQANNNSAGAIHDEVGLHKIARHERWVVTPTKVRCRVIPSSITELGRTSLFEDTVSGVRKASPSHPSPGLRRRFPNLHRGGLLRGCRSTPQRVKSRSHGRGGSEQLYGNCKRRQPRAWAEQNLFHQDFRSRCVSLQDELHAFGLCGSSTLNQFPVLLTFVSGISGFSYNSFASATAGDLRFYASTGELPYEIETWDITGTSHLGLRRMISEPTP